jgi:RimJ/RimL family protein N-acetyltransferase
MTLLEIEVRRNRPSGMLDGMDLHPVAADDPARVRLLRDLLNETNREDSPWWPAETDATVERELRHAWEGEPGRWFLVGDDAADPDGHLVVHTSDYDNLELAWLGLAIRPGRRRAGRGRAALASALDLCRSIERPLVGMDGWESEATAGFATATGFTLRSRTIVRRLSPRQLERGLIDRLADEAAAYAEDYELVRFTGAVPEELLGPIADLTASINDAPTDDLEMEDELYSAERIRAYEHAQAAGGWVLRRLAARHRRSGELAGHTVVAVDGHRPSVGFQHDTAVARRHRGHRLGLLLKAEMLRWLALEEPQLETIDTFNAESNSPMVAVNERLGHQVLGRQLEFQRRI